MPTETPLSVEQDFTATTTAARRRSWKIAGDLPAFFHDKAPSGTRFFQLFTQNTLGCYVCL